MSFLKTTQGVGWLVLALLVVVVLWIYDSHNSKTFYGLLKAN
jgi:hypothetical protein